METATLKNRISDRWEKQNIPAARNFHLPGLTNRIKNTKNWANGELVSLILLKKPEKQVLLTAIHEGTEIFSFQSKISVTIQTIEGKLFFHVKNKSTIIEPGQILTLTDKVKYKLKCLEKTIFLFTIHCNPLNPGYLNS